jgi:hypothetical protein
MLLLFAGDKRMLPKRAERVVQVSVSEMPVSDILLHDQ